MTGMGECILIKGAAAGLVSGVFLGLFLKVIEFSTSEKVYTLLLNVDYVPVLKRYQFSELVEFVLHLIVSVVLGIGVSIVLSIKNWSPAGDILFTTRISLLIGTLLYPTTALSNRTPDIWDGGAILLWLVGHGLFGYVLGYLLKRGET